MNISAANRAWKDEAEKRREKQEQSRNLPSRFQGGRPAPRLVLIIDKGNELETGQDGIEFAEDPITELPSAYDPETDDSFITGIGRGWLIENEVMAEEMVLIVNDGSSSYPDALFQGDRIRSGGAKTIPVAGGGSKQVYVAG